MKKIIIILLLFLIFDCGLIFAEGDSNTYDKMYDDFISFSEQYDTSDINDNAASSDSYTNTQKIFKKIYELFFAEIKSSLTMFFCISFVCVLASLIKIFVEKTSLADIGCYGCYCVCAGAIILNFSKINNVCQASITDLSDFMDLAVPTYSAMLTGCGYGATAASLQGVFVIISIVITHLIENLICPLLFCCGLLAIVSGISTTIELTRFIKLISKTIKYVIGIIITVFAGILTFTGFAASAGDNVAVKTAKYAISNFVPVVGGCLSEALNGIVQSSLHMKNTIGYLGFITLLSMCMLPVIKVFVTVFCFRLSASTAELLAESRLGTVLDCICDVLETLLGMLILVTVIFMLIIGIISSVG